MGDRAGTPPLYVIVDREYAGDDARWLALLAAVAAAVDGAPALVQVRAKGLPAAEFRALAARARAAARTSAPLVLNGDAALARTLGYEGVHWPEAAIPPAPAEGDLPWRTAAVHSPAAVRRARAAGATALVFAPVFAPGSKPGAGAGLDALRAVVAASDRPVYALGGVTPERVADCLAAGAAGVAVVSGVLGAPSPAEGVAAYLAALRTPATPRRA